LPSTQRRLSAHVAVALTVLAALRMSPILCIKEVRTPGTRSQSLNGVTAPARKLHLEKQESVCSSGNVCVRNLHAGFYNLWTTKVIKTAECADSDG